MTIVNGWMRLLRSRHRRMLAMTPFSMWFRLAGIRQSKNLLNLRSLHLPAEVIEPVEMQAGAKKSASAFFAKQSHPPSP